MKGRAGRVFTAAKPGVRRITKQAKDALVEEAKKKWGQHYSPARVDQFIKKLVSKAASGKSETAKRVLATLAAGTAVVVGGEVIKLLPPPIAGIVAPENKKAPMSTSSNINTISGHNALYNAKEHVVKFESGFGPGSWMRSLKKLQGEHTISTRNTTELYKLDNTSRPQLLKNFGLNQKMQMAVSTTNFGFAFSSLLQYFSLSTFDSSLARTQVGYGAISHLTSKATITSLNRYVPIYVKMTLLRTEVTNDNFITAWVEGINTTDGAQIDGAMPLYYQQEDKQTDTILGNAIHVDPKTNGIRTSEKWKATMVPVESKTVKLYAGDRIKLDYTHLCGSGVRLDKLHGCERDTSWNNDHPITYSLMVESWGEEVDAYLWSNPNSIIKGTSPGSLQFEFSKHITGISPSNTGSEQINTGGGKGYISNRYAVKVYTKSPLVSTSRRYFGLYSNLTATTVAGYRVPVMSDAVQQDAGKIS